MLYNDGVLKVVGLNKVIIDRYNDSIEVLNKIVNTKTSKKAEERWTGIVGIGTAEVKPRGQDMTFKDLYVENPKQVLMETVAVGLRLYYEDLEDDQYDALKQVAGEIGQAHRKFREMQRANLFNMGFTTAYRTGYDNLALFSTAHTLTGAATYAVADTNLTAVPARSTTTWSNRLGTDSDFDYTSYSDACVLLARCVDRQGDFMNLTPSWILFPPELRTAVREVLGSTDRPDTANRSTSGILKDGVDQIMSSYLVDSDAWFLGAESNDLQFFNRMDLKTKYRDAQGSWDWLVETMSRSGVGFHDPRRVVGTPGA